MVFASSYIRIKRSLRECSLRPSLRLCLFEEGFCIDLFGFLIALPFLDRFSRHPQEIMEAWGVYYDFEYPAAVWCWGDFTKFFRMPWRWDFIRVDVRCADGTWTKRVQSYEVGEPDNREIHVFDYTYKLNSGEVQHRKATCHVERYEWRRWFMKWTSLFAKIRESVEIEFDGEVGERSGSWKGGCIGCGTDLLPGESVESAVRRMERERKF